MDRTAYNADGVMLVGRVKWHTDFAGKLESGLFKMMAIGLGKFAGAQRYHAYAYRLGLEAVIRSVGRQVLASGKILGGLAILEDGYHNTAKLEAVPVEGMEAARGRASGAGEDLDAARPAARRGSADRQRTRQAHLRLRHGLQGHQPQRPWRLQPLA